MEGHELSNREDVPTDTEECETDRETEIVVFILNWNCFLITGAAG
jgi:hypothetical protein